MPTSAHSWPAARRSSATPRPSSARSAWSSCASSTASCATTCPGAARVCAVIRKVRPDIVLGHDPWRQYRLHPDHRQAGHLTIGAIVAARDPHFFPELGLAPHRPATLLCFEPARVDHVESVPGHVDRKIAALLRHRSQWRSTMGIDDRPDDQRSKFARDLHDEARAAALHAGLRSAEAFARIDDL